MQFFMGFLSVSQITYIFPCHLWHDIYISFYQICAQRKIDKQERKWITDTQYKWNSVLAKRAMNKNPPLFFLPDLASDVSQSVLKKWNYFRYFMILMMDWKVLVWRINFKDPSFNLSTLSKINMEKILLTWTTIKRKFLLCFCRVFLYWGPVR